METTITRGRNDKEIDKKKTAEQVDNEKKEMQKNMHLKEMRIEILREKKAHLLELINKKSTKKVDKLNYQLEVLDIDEMLPTLRKYLAGYKKVYAETYGN
jgi:uncharacterized protein YPO0396